jgi:tetratricopeptide (TPR) repeat protein
MSTIPKAFADQPDFVNWWWNERAYVYQYLGDYPHVLESFRAGIAAGERGQPNVSQLLNLAEAQIRFKHYDDALATLAPAASGPNRSPYGDMVYHEVHGCAAFKAGKKDIAAPDIAYVRAHEKDGRIAAQALLSCIGDTDGAIALLLRRLDDPDDRIRALRELSDYVPDPAARPLWPGAEKWKQTKARPDIKAAAAKAGGTLTFPFRSGFM